MIRVTPQKTFGSRLCSDIDLVYLQRPVDENTKHGALFMLRPNPSNPASAPNANGSPQTPSASI
jgi:hypothetical protein